MPRNTHKIALDLTSLDVAAGDLVFVLGNRKDGKSALRDSLKAIFSFPSNTRDDATIPQSNDNTAPPIQLDYFWRHPDMNFHEISGDPQTLNREMHANSLNFCDDPMFPKTQISSGSKIIEQSSAMSLTLMIGADPDRLEEALRCFLEFPQGRILWLDRGTIFWTGQSSELRSQLAILCDRYTVKHPNPEHNFLEAVKNAFR